MTLVHFAFDIMVLIATLLLALVVWYAIAYWRRRDVPQLRLFLWVAAAAGVLSYIAIEAGWVTTEVGRQPWIVYNIARTSSAVTTSSGVPSQLHRGHRAVRAAGGRHDHGAPRDDPTMAQTADAEDTATTTPRPYGPEPAKPNSRPRRYPSGRRRERRRRRRSPGSWSSAITLYAWSGIADFGAGFWDLHGRRRSRSGRRVRALIDQVVTPVWEANHVWLIFILVTAAGPGSARRSAPVMTTLFVPLSLGRARHRAARRRTSRCARTPPAPAAAHVAGWLFGLGAIITPFFFGTAVGAIMAGRVPADGSGDPVSSWWNRRLDQRRRC